MPLIEPTASPTPIDRGTPTRGHTIAPQIGWFWDTQLATPGTPIKYTGIILVPSDLQVTTSWCFPNPTSFFEIPQNLMLVPDWKNTFLWCKFTSRDNREMFFTHTSTISLRSDSPTPVACFLLDSLITVIQ